MMKNKHLEDHTKIEELVLLNYISEYFEQTIKPKISKTMVHGVSANYSETRPQEHTVIGPIFKLKTEVFLNDIIMRKSRKVRETPGVPKWDRALT